MGYFRLIRPRIVALVLFAMAVAARTAAEEPPPWPELLHALLGAGLVIMGAIALNQRLESHGDAQMARTAARPLPSGQLTQRHVTAFGLTTSGVGLTYLLFWSHLGVVVVVVASWVVYVWAYTPLKSVTLWQTPIGAVAGAMPVLLGATVARAPMSPMAVTLFGVVYFWQFPHAMAIAWLYREDFGAAKVKLATVVDPSGRAAGTLAVLGAVALLPVSLVPPLMSLASWAYGACAVALGGCYLACALRFFLLREDHSARWLLRLSLIYLPVLLLALLV
jgi:protoheme IX farnesyltransferase